MDAAASAALAESAGGPTYASVAAGEAATVAGQAFAVQNIDGTVSVYLRDGGGSTLQRTLATTGALAASTGASLVGFQQSGTGTVARTVQDKARESVSIADRTDFATALAQVPSGGGRLIATPGTISITEDTTIPANVDLDVHRGAIFSIATGVTLTVLGQITAGNQEVFDGDGTVNLDNSPNEYNLAWFKSTNGYINERWDFAKRGMTSFRTKTIRIPRPYDGQAGVVKTGGRLFWQFNAPIIIDDDANASTWYIDGEFSAAGDCDAFMQFDDTAKPENIYFYGPIQASASAAQTVGVGIEVLAGSRLSFFGQVVLNGFQTPVKLGGADQTGSVEDIYMPRTQFSFFSVAALDIYGTATGTVQNVEIGNLRVTAAQASGLPVARLRGLMRDVTIDNIYYATDTAKNGYLAVDAGDVVLIESNAEGAIQHVKIGAIYQANANNGLRIQSANSNASGVIDVEVGRIFGKPAGNAAVIDYCQRVRLLGVENGSDVTIGSNVGSAEVNYTGAGLRALTNNSTSSIINGLGRQNRGAGLPPAPAVAWPLGALIREQGDGKIYQRVANAGVAADFVLIGGPATATYTATNVTTDRTFDADTVAVAELADVVGTLIADLRARGVVL